MGIAIADWVKLFITVFKLKVSIINKSNINLPVSETNL